MITKKITRAYKEGQSSAEMGGHIAHNPYCSRNDFKQHNDWSRGFTDTLKARHQIRVTVPSQ